MSKAILINTDLDDDCLKMANWLRTEVGEMRQWGEKSLLAFMSHYDIQEFFDLMEEIMYEPWVDGTTKLEYNGHDYVVDIYWLLKELGIPHELVYDEWKEGEKYD